MADSRIALLLDMVDQAYERKSWHGTNLRGSVRRLDALAAAWHPAPGRNSICDLVLHAAYWKYAVRRRLTGEKRGSFAIKGSNWFKLPDEVNEDVWEAALALLGDEHRKLREAVAAFPARKLETKSGTMRYVDLITGIAAHDLYHAGQIQLLKRLQKK
jgi:uncharacterized damage-inducible protein DinB